MAREPEGCYDKQEEAIAASRKPERANGVKLYVHGEDGLVREQTEAA